MLDPCAAGAGLYFEYSGNIVAWASILIRNCTFSGNTALGSAFPLPPLLQPHAGVYSRFVFCADVQAGENVDVVFLEASGNVTQSSLNAFRT